MLRRKLKVVNEMGESSHELEHHNIYATKEAISTKEISEQSHERTEGLNMKNRTKTTKV